MTEWNRGTNGKGVAPERRSEIELAIESEATVLIVGATGTGKSTLAEEIHRRGRRGGEAFVSVNLASLHEATIESTLFGHERGAFTGADRARMGRLESADGGTLFLDEIGELSLPLQARLLEFLQSRTLVPLGSNRPRRVDVRIVCATHRDLEAETRRGRFREDLFHRIRVLEIELPSLGALEGEAFDAAIHRAIERAAGKLGRSVYGIAGDVAELFECYSWPGNFRELENLVEVSLLACAGRELRVADLPKSFVARARAEPAFGCDRQVSIRPERSGAAFPAAAEAPVSKSYTDTMKKFETALLRYYVEKHRGNLARAAREVGLPKATFYRKIQSHGLLEAVDA